MMPTPGLDFISPDLLCRRSRCLHGGADPIVASIGGFQAVALVVLKQKEVMSTTSVTRNQIHSWPICCQRQKSNANLLPTGSAARRLVRTVTCCAWR